MKHDFDTDTEFCRKCGISMLRLMEGRDRRIECPDADNITGISHIICARAMERILEGKQP